VIREEPQERHIVLTAHTIWIVGVAQSHTELLAI